MSQRLVRALFLSTACLFLPPWHLDAQSTDQGTPASAKETKSNRKHDSKAAAKAYHRGLEAAKREQYEVALKDFSDAVDLDPTRPEYLESRELTRQQWVKALLATADQQLVAKNPDAAKTLARVQQIDPQNPLLQER